MNDAAIAALVANYGPDHNGALKDLVEDIKAGVEVVSVRNGIVRVGEAEYQDGTTWYYRGHSISWGTGRFARRYSPGDGLRGGHDTLTAWKKAIDAKLGT